MDLISCEKAQRLKRGAEFLSASNFSAFANVTDEINFILEEDLYPELSRLVRWLVPICFGIIAISGFLGNVLVIVVVLFNRKMHSTTNLLIVNLACADLLFVVFCIPFTAVDYLLDNWPFGQWWCRIVQYLIVVTAFASIYTLVLMSIDRFLAVVHPICSRMLRTVHFTRICILCLWCLILFISLPVAATHGVTRYEDQRLRVSFEVCQFVENELLSPSVYQMSFFTSSYLVPLIVISALYLRMIASLWQENRGIRLSQESHRGRKRVTRLVVVVVIAFAALWFPIQLVLLLKSLKLYEIDNKLNVVLQIVAQTLAYTSSCINPLLYAFLSGNFRKAFRKAMNSLKRLQCNNRAKEGAVSMSVPLSGRRNSNWLHQTSTTVL